jgi:hypothetical protein
VVELTTRRTGETVRVPLDDAVATTLEVLAGAKAEAAGLVDRLR